MEKKREKKEFPPVEIPTPVVSATDPPVPNRAWTEMKLGRDIEELSEEEKAELYLGRDHFL